MTRIVVLSGHWCVRMLLVWLCVVCLSFVEPLPLVVTTWAADGFQQATNVAYTRISEGRLFSLVEGLSTCERLQCDTTVGFGGSPDEKGETTLDALLMDGPGHRVGAVAALRRVKDAARVAWAVMNYTSHTLLAGEAATHFAIEMGFREESLGTKESREQAEKWREHKCQPNYRQNVHPDPTASCGPYKPDIIQHDERFSNRVSRFDHDTIGMVVIDKNGEVSAGTSTNGKNHKVAGRVGDSPIPGAGAFLRRGVGGAAATGDGDIILRYLPSFHAVSSLERGLSPEEAAQHAIRPILKDYPNFSGAVIVADVKGRYSASCAGMETFSYSVQDGTTPTTMIHSVPCLR